MPQQPKIALKMRDEIITLLLYYDFFKIKYAIFAYVISRYQELFRDMTNVTLTKLTYLGERHLKLL